MSNREFAPRPNEFDDDEWDAYKRGAADMAAHIANMATMVAASAGRATPNKAPADATDERPDVCDCGGEVRYEMGSATGVCVSCGARHGSNY